MIRYIIQGFALLVAFKLILWNLESSLLGEKAWLVKLINCSDAVS